MKHRAKLWHIFIYCCVSRDMFWIEAARFIGLPCIFAVQHLVPVCKILNSKQLNFFKQQYIIYYAEFPLCIYTWKYTLPTLQMRDFQTEAIVLVDCSVIPRFGSCLHWATILHPHRLTISRDPSSIPVALFLWFIAIDVFHQLGHLAPNK